jgi:D-alanine-D-alanine ligase
MTRIGFAYNQKPDVSLSGERATDLTARPAADLPAGDDEPPSTGAGMHARTSTVGAASWPPALRSAPHGDVTIADEPTPDDEFAEWDTPETVTAVANALAALGTVVHLEATPDFPVQLRDARVDIVFNMAEGLRGKNRESLVPAICEFYGVPYSGSDPLTLSLCLDKGRTKEILSYHGIPTAPFVVVDGGFDGGDPWTAGDVSGFDALEFPLFVKPIHEGSSKGITERNLCRTREELLTQIEFLLDTYAQPVLVEHYLTGAEFTCAVLGNGRSAQVLPIVGMNFDALPLGTVPVYGFEAKWVWDSRDAPLNIFDCPAHIPVALRQSIEGVALSAYRVLGCRDWARVDIRLDAKGVPNVVEVNPLPGILPNPDDHSCFPKAARAAGIGYDELIQSCLMLAAERHGVVLERNPETRT